MNLQIGCHKLTYTEQCKGVILDPHEFTKLLELFSATAWTRQTGEFSYFMYNYKDCVSVPKFYCRFHSFINYFII